MTEETNMPVITDSYETSDSILFFFLLLVILFDCYGWFRKGNEDLLFFFLLLVVIFGNFYCL